MARTNVQPGEMDFAKWRKVWSAHSTSGDHRWDYYRPGSSQRPNTIPVSPGAPNPWVQPYTPPQPSTLPPPNIGTPVTIATDTDFTVFVNMEEDGSVTISVMFGDGRMKTVTAKGPWEALEILGSIMQESWGEDCL